MCMEVGDVQGLLFFCAVVWFILCALGSDILWLDVGEVLLPCLDLQLGIRKLCLCALSAFGSLDKGGFGFQTVTSEPCS